MKKIAFYSVIISFTLMSSCSSKDEDIYFDNINDVQQILLSQTEISDLKVLREEEKLARDVYLYAYDKYGTNIFINISKSEQQHMDRILVLLSNYNIVDPALPNNGEFTNQELQELYDDLTAQVDISLVEALNVGATVEDLDIKDIDDFEKRTDKSDILDVYERLKCGSRNHIRNYYNQLVKNGVFYSAQFISASELTAIINSSNEQCGN